MNIFLIFFALLIVFISFYVGVYVGINDCKKQFNIPKGAKGVTSDGEYIVTGTDNKE